MREQRKILFLDRDGTLIFEPDDKQVDSIEKLILLPNVIHALHQFKNAGYAFVMVTNQDGLNTPSFPEKKFLAPHQLMLQIFESQGITFESVRICPHTSRDRCQCRKPLTGLVNDYIISQNFDIDNSFMIGDRDTDTQFAENIGLSGFKIGSPEYPTWNEITNALLNKPRTAKVIRTTNETSISVQINLDIPYNISIKTGIGFFDHLLEQLAKHGGFSLELAANGDLHIDDHHTIEDVAITLGESIKKSLGDKRGIQRYGFLLPMDEALCQVALDLCNRSYFVFNGQFTREMINDFPTEMVSHFFRSLSESLKATLHISVTGENTHHMIESVFKAVGRTLKLAICKKGNELPSTKGVL